MTIVSLHKGVKIEARIAIPVSWACMSRNQNLRLGRNSERPSSAGAAADLLGVEGAFSMLQEIIDSMGDGLAFVDVEGKMLVFNKAAQSLYGCDRRELPLELRARALGNYLPDKVTPFPIDQLPVVRALRGENVDQVEVYIRNERQRGVLVSSTARPVRDSSGVIKGAVAVFRDITALKETIDENNRLKTRMFQRQKLEGLGMLAGGIAHDFNNLLMSVLGNAALALHESPPHSRLQSLLEQTIKAGQRLAELTGQLLALTGEGGGREEVIDLSAAVDEMRELLTTVVSKRARMEAECPRGLWIRADATQVRQAVMNLIVNASDSLMGAAGSITVRTSMVNADRGCLDRTYFADALAEGRFACVEVADTGCGMDAETLARIFDPFFTTKSMGRGLGLATTAGIVRRHGGAIAVESEPGRGSVFRLLFPAAAGMRQAEPRQEETEAAVGGSGTILVIDDEEAVRSVARAILPHFGYQVLAACNGSEGIKMFETEGAQVSAVLLDLTMPDLSGEEVLCRLKRLRPELPVVLSSGYRESRKLGGFLREPTVAYLQKPYLPRALLSKISEVMSARS